MRSVKSLIAAGAATLISSAAFAADMAIAPPPPMYAPPPVVEDFGGWYLRGDIGFSNQRVSRLNNVLDAGIHHVGAEPTASTPRASSASASATSSTTGSAPTSPVNIAAIRSSSEQTRITFPGGFGTDTYHGTKSEWVVLANAYVDLGTWWCMTPFIGAGVGGARVSINNFTDQSIANAGLGAQPGLAFGDNYSKWNLAWALHAGVAYKVTPNFTVELAYRYLDMGDGLTGDLRTFDGVNDINNPMTFKSITSHDLKLGVRWDLSSPPVYRAAADAQGLIDLPIS